MDNSSGTRFQYNLIIKLIFLTLFFTLFFYLLISQHKGEEAQSLSLEEIKNISIPGYKAEDLKEFVEPPGNVTRFYSKSWKKKSEIVIGNETYIRLSSEIRLNIYEFNKSSSVDKNYVLEVERFPKENKMIFSIGNCIVERYRIQTDGSSMYRDLFQLGNSVYVLRYFEDSKDQAREILESIIL